MAPKIIKPLKLGLLYRVFETTTKHLLCVSALAFAPFPLDNNSLLHTEQELWSILTSQLGKDLILDQSLPKQHGEVLVTGKFFTPFGRPVRAQKVRMRLGNLEKELYIFGDRFWMRTKTGAWAITDPEPLTEMDISYPNAFGGPNYAKNPLGKGIEPIILPSGETAIPLPNIELPDQLIASRRDRPDPAGFGPIDITWPQRATKAGTYDKKWLKQRFPGYPDDIDWAIFNMAPDDQQIDGFFEGNEEFQFENMHPEKSTIMGRLPGIRVRCFVTQKQGGEEVFKEVSTRIDTVWFFPHIEKVLLIYRGLVEVIDDEASDILHLLIACEGPKDESRPEEHYKKALDKRLDEETGPLNMLDESDLLPDGEPSTVTELMAPDSKEEDIFGKNMQVRMKREKENAIKMLEEQGLDTSDIIREPEPSPEINMDNLAELPGMIQEIEKKIEQTQKEMEERARKMLEAAGLDMEEVMEEARKRERRWPTFSAEETVRRLREFGIQDESIEQKLREVEEEINNSLRTAVHYLPPSYAPEEREKEEKKSLVLRAKEEGLSLADVDLAYVDLSGLDLSGIDLSKAYLEGATLTHTNLENANLSGAILVRATLDNTRLSNADLSEANLGHAKVVSSDLSSTQMADMVVAEAELQRSTFDNAIMENVDLTKATIEDCSFNGTSMREAMLMETSFSSSKFYGCDLSEAIFLYTVLEKCDFSEANLTSATFVKVPAKEALFKHANLSKCCITDQSDFSGADFSKAVLTEANFRGTKLIAATFNEADLSNSDLSQCDLKDASFRFSVAKRTQFAKSDLTRAQMQYINLMEGSLQNALLFETNLRGANLYGVDFIRVRIEKADFTDANLKRAFLDRWKEQ